MIEFMVDAINEIIAKNIKNEYKFKNFNPKKRIEKINVTNIVRNPDHKVTLKLHVEFKPPLDFTTQQQSILLLLGKFYPNILTPTEIKDYFKGEFEKSAISTTLGTF